MPQLEFTQPDFMDGCSAEDIHERMMANLPDDIDSTPGGFPYDLTMPSAIEKSELVNFHLERALMLAFPQFAWDSWLDLHGQQVHVARHKGHNASGVVEITGEPGTEIEAGTVFLAPATGSLPAIGFATDTGCTIGENGTASASVTAVEAGAASNVKAGAVTIMDEPLDGVTGITNPLAITGGTSDESDDSYYDRIAAEYENSRTYLGNDGDYKRWAQEAGAGDCIVSPAADGPGTVKLVLVDQNGQPASQKLTEEVYNYIVSPSDRTKRLLPTACAKLICVPATTVTVNYSCSGLQFDASTNIEEIKKDFEEALKKIYEEAKTEGILRYNKARSLIVNIGGVEDFKGFLMNGTTENIPLESGEYPETGICDFSQEEAWKSLT